MYFYRVCNSTHILYLNTIKGTCGSCMSFCENITEVSLVKLITITNLTEENSRFFFQCNFNLNTQLEHLLCQPDITAKYVKACKSM